jgi:cyclopropane fatty-acyl-phospholipid synthase-like methyltransferase
MKKPYSESSDQNKHAILDVIAPILSKVGSVLEIGSGTGQHAVFFSEKMPQLIWHTSDCQPYIEGINSWINEAKLENVIAPIELNVSYSKWPEQKMDAIFTANSAHIMNNDEVKDLIEGVTVTLKENGSLLIYGPFNYDGNYTSESNKKFDCWLKDRDTLSGIKDFETINRLAVDNGLSLKKDYEMPANNRILHFVKNLTV